MKNNLLENLIGRTYETRFDRNFKEEAINFMRNLDDEIIKKICKLKDYDFIYYLSFLYKMYLKNNNLNIYEDKLIKITNLLIPRIGSVPISPYVDIMANTNLIDDKDIVKFTSIFLNIKEIDRIDKLVDLIYNEDIKDNSFNLLFKEILNSKSEIEIDFILCLLNNKRIIDNEIELKKALGFLHKTKDEDKLVAFYKIFIIGDLKDISLYSNYALTLEDAILESTYNYQLEIFIKMNSLLKQSKFRNSLIKKILNTKNKIILNEYLEISKIPNILNNNNILEIMDKLDNLKDETDGIIIKKLLSINPSNVLLLIDEVLKKNGNVNVLYAINYLEKVNNILINDRDLFGIVLGLKENYKYEFLMKVLDYNLINKNNIKVIKDFLNVKEEYKYKAFIKYLSNNLNNKDFRLDSDYSNNIIMLIKGVKKDFQANTLVRVSNIIKEDKYNLLIKAAFVKNEAVGILLGDLLETKVKDDGRFNDILDNFESCKSLIGQVGMVELARNDKLLKSEFLMGYFMIMKRLTSINQVGILIRILENYPNLNDYNLFKYCEKIMFVTNYPLLLILEKLIMNNKMLDKETIDTCILAIDKNSTFENIKFIIEYLKTNNMEDIIKWDIDTAESIDMLNRQKELELNPNSILTYKKERRE